jgi:signal transduction histidine kinase
LKLGFWQSHWRAFAASYVPEEVEKASGPGAILFVLAAFVAVVAVPAYVEPFASKVGFHHPLLPMLVMAVACGFSYVGWRHGLRGPVGMTCTLADTAVSLGAFQLAAVSTTPPASYAYAGVAGLVALATHARLYSLTLPLGVVVSLPLLGIPVAFGADAPLLIISFSSCVLFLWSSNMTRTASLLRRQNVRLRSALETANEVVDNSRQIALAGILLDVGYFVHEIRNAQASISANASYLLETQPTGSEQRECLEELGEANKRLQSIVNETLALLKARRPDDTGSFSVGNALRKLPVWSDGAQVATVVEANAMRVVGVERDLVGAISQLIRNAGQAGARTIRITASPSPTGHAVQIAVDDDGHGMPEEQRAHLFQPFGTNRGADGLGLGLYLTQKRVELMGGRLQVDASELGGARFLLELPLTTRTGPSDQEQRTCSTTKPVSGSPHEA